MPVIKNIKKNSEFNICYHLSLRELTDISVLKSYIHLRYVDISQNNLRDISALSSLSHMLTLNADDNKLTSAALDQMPYLQVANFNKNRIKTTEGLNHPLMEHLSVNCE